jgi:hypothetical protein
LGGCGDEIVDPTGDPAVGTYALQRVNGQALPYSFGQEVWEAMSLTLTADQKVAGSLRWRETDASGATVEQGTDQIAGTYTRSGTQLTITLADDDPAPAVVEGSTLTMTSDGAVLVFRRQ